MDKLVPVSLKLKLAPADGAAGTRRGKISSGRGEGRGQRGPRPAGTSAPSWGHFRPRSNRGSGSCQTWALAGAPDRAPARPPKRPDAGGRRPTRRRLSYAENRHLSRCVSRAISRPEPPSFDTLGSHLHIRPRHRGPDRGCRGGLGPPSMDGPRDARTTPRPRADQPRSGPAPLPNGSGR
jgi:hypothetical protein